MGRSSARSQKQQWRPASSCSFVRYGNCIATNKAALCAVPNALAETDTVGPVNAQKQQEQWLTDA